MDDKQIEEILKKSCYIDIYLELLKLYPKGFNIDKIDKRIRDRMNEICEKNYSIQEPIQLRRNNE